jgi:hypothetical protein
MVERIIWTWGRCDSAKADYQQSKERLVLGVLLGQTIDQLRRVVGETGPPQVLAKANERVYRLYLRNDIEVASTGEHDLGVREELEVTAKTTRWAANTLGDRAHLAGVGRIQSNDPISFAKVMATQNNRLGPDKVRRGHARLLGLACPDIIRVAGVRRKQPDNDAGRLGKRSGTDLVDDEDLVDNTLDARYVAGDILHLAALGRGL